MKTATPLLACSAQGQVRYGHHHTCSGHNPTDDPDMHYCPMCKTWWWTR